MAEFNWTPEQQSMIDSTIEMEIESSRLAHKVIPETTISPTERFISHDRYDYAKNMVIENPIAVKEPLENFKLTKPQTEDVDLGRALVRIRRATQQLARRHDDEVFRASIRDELNAKAGKPGHHNVFYVKPDSSARYGDNLMAETAAAVSAIDGEGYRVGFVMIAGQEVYRQLHLRPLGTSGLPIKAVQGLLDNGPVYRSAVLPPDEALVLSISGGEIDRAVGISPTCEFLRIGAKEEREFRLYERFVPRFKQTFAAALLRLVPAGKGGP